MAGIGVVIPVHDAAGPFVDAAVRSVRAQETSVPVEIILVDDHCRDPATLATLGRLAAEEGVRVVANHGPSGAARARNAGVRAADGDRDWIAFLDADDVWPPGSLARRWAVVAADPVVRWVAGDHRIWTAEGLSAERGTTYARWFHDRYRGEAVLRVERPVAQMIPWTTLHVGGVLVRRDLLNAVGGFDERLAYGEDWYLWVLLATVADLHFVPEVVLHLRRHDQASLTADIARRAHENARARRLALADPRLKEYRRLIRWRLAEDYRVSAMLFDGIGATGPALRMAAAALFRTPNSLRCVRLLRDATVRHVRASIARAGFVTGPIETPRR